MRHLITTTLVGLALALAPACGGGSTNPGTDSGAGSDGASSGSDGLTGGGSSDGSGGTTDPGTTDPGTSDPGTTDPGTSDPGTTDPGASDPVTPPVDPASVVTPDQPGASDVTFTVDSTRDVHPISPYVYGTNQHDFTKAPFDVTFGRAGGNRYTAYNWENNASNAGSDWCYQNDGLLGGGDVPGGSVQGSIDAAHAADASMLITVPIVDYVAADKNGGNASCSGNVMNSPNYLQTRFDRNVARKDGALSLTPDTSDGVVYQDEFVNWVESTYPGAHQDPKHEIFYSLDNEPDLWPETHSEIHPDKPTYEEIAQRTIDYASMIKDIAPDATVFGSVNYGWLGLETFSDASDAQGRNYVDYFLTTMKQAEQDYGHRLVDVFDFHWYPEARGGGQRITADDASPAVAEARMQAPRSLWDDTYVEDSWVAQYHGNKPLTLLRDLQSKIDQDYPGTKMAITEYYYGGGADISGGIAQADVLGIYGREGVFAANMFHLGGTDDRYIAGAFEMFRNFDGQGTSFGDTSIHADTDDREATSVYASVDEGHPERMILVVINKKDQPLTAGISVTHTATFTQGHVYQMTPGNPGAVQADDVTFDGTNALRYTMPAHSVSTLVLE